MPVWRVGGEGQWAVLYEPGAGSEERPGLEIRMWVTSIRSHMIYRGAG